MKTVFKGVRIVRVASPLLVPVWTWWWWQKSPSLSTVEPRLFTAQSHLTGWHGVANTRLPAKY